MVFIECGWSQSTYLSPNVNVSGHSRYDLNVRSIVAFREIGRGLASIETFCRIMNNMFPPLSKSNYQEMVKDMSPVYISAMKDSMKDAKNAKVLEAGNVGVMPPLTVSHQ